MKRPNVLRFSCRRRRAAQDAFKKDTISRAEGGQLQAPVGRARPVALPNGLYAGLLSLDAYGFSSTRSTNCSHLYGRHSPLSES
jgi:hypothetical protein